MASPLIGPAAAIAFGVVRLRTISLSPILIRRDGPSVRNTTRAGTCSERWSRFAAYAAEGWRRNLSLPASASAIASADGESTPSCGGLRVVVDATGQPSQDPLFDEAVEGEVHGLAVAQGRKTSGHEARPAPGFLHAGPNLALDAIWELTGGTHLRKDATFFIDDQARSRHESIAGIRKAAGKTEGQKKGSIGPSPPMLLPYNANVDLPQLVVNQRLPTEPRCHCNTPSTALTRCSAWLGVRGHTRDGHHLIHHGFATVRGNRPSLGLSRK